MTNISSAPTPFQLVYPLKATPHLPIILCSPHSGNYYPDDMISASRLGLTALRRSEDAFVEQLINIGPSLGMTSLCAHYARAYVDVNRNVNEVDPSLFDEKSSIDLYVSNNDLIHSSKYITAQERITAGLGVVARVVGHGLNIYNRKLALSEFKTRIEIVYDPWHTALKHEMNSLHQQYGLVVMLDWHSMPSDSTSNRRSEMSSDIVLGDRWGQSCHPALLSTVANAFKDQGLSVGYNTPYAGGYATETYGRPENGFHALQIEINRSIYMNEEKIIKNSGFFKLKEQINNILIVLKETLLKSQLTPIHFKQAAE